MPTMSGYVKTFKVEDKINKLMYFRTYDDTFLENHQGIWFEIETLITKY